MSDPFFFGYGSLVNTKTHDYPDVIPAQLNGWRRVWRHTKIRDVAYFSVEKAEDSTIDGLIARVPNSDWVALDEREFGYWREPVPPEALTFSSPVSTDVQIYQTRTDQDAEPSVKHPIILSYLDVVVQGFLAQFGEDGVGRFFETTAGWEAPILNDRQAPIYPRHQSLTPFETGLVDAHLETLSAHVQDLHETDMGRERL
ncbi:MAG: gamma-glutamylcyclotransferase [Litoreibacter sp.]|nr:gamma-glutamylcyclotransferase [Litoreibacter sp.]MCY4336982.1 gamma-glutamylcyclotransferase [Litoreibacter sp.]